MQIFDTKLKLYFLISVFVIGFSSLTFTSYLFSSFVDDLDKEIINQEAKIEIGHYLDEDIYNRIPIL